MIDRVYTATMRSGDGHGDGPEAGIGRPTDHSVVRSSCFSGAKNAQGTFVAPPRSTAVRGIVSGEPGFFRHASAKPLDVWSRSLISNVGKGRTGHAKLEVLEGCEIDIGVGGAFGLGFSTWTSTTARHCDLFPSYALHLTFCSSSQPPASPPCCVRGPW